LNETSGGIVAIIPVREGSQRILNKNFKVFADGMSLLEIKINQLKKEKCFDKIYISSDSQCAKEIAEKNSIGFLERNIEMCSSSVRWSDVIFAVANSIPEPNPIVAWVHTTSPLHTEYAKPIEEFIALESVNDSIVTVSPFQEFIINKKGRPVNYHWGAWHDYSQDLDELYKVTGALFIARKQNMTKWRYVIGVNPFLYKVDRTVAIDVDTEEDFKLAQQFYFQQNT
jgi:CMP-N-acetylneuraminic acid synthetase